MPQAPVENSGCDVGDVCDSRGGAADDISTVNNMKGIDEGKACASQVHFLSTFYLLESSAKPCRKAILKSTARSSAVLQASVTGVPRTVLLTELISLAVWPCGLCPLFQPAKDYVDP